MSSTTRFCAACGTANEIDASFCDHCGEPMKKRGAQLVLPVSSTPPTQTPRTSGLAIKTPGRLLWGGIAALVLVVAAVAGWALLASGGPSSTDQDRMAREWLARNKAELMQAACLRNFAYATNPVTVNAWNRQTRDWLDALVAGGVYESRGADAAGNLLFAHGPQAVRHIRNGRLCLADDVELREVTLQKPEGGDDRVARLSVGFGWTGVPEFASKAPVSQALGDKLSSRSEMLTLVRKDGEWAEATQKDLFALAGNARGAQEASPPKADAGAGIGRWLSGLFAWGGGPAQAAESFYRAVADGNAKEALELIHPSQRSPAVDSKIGLMVEAQRAQVAGVSAGALSLKAVVEQENDSTAQVRVEFARPDGAAQSERLTLRKHEGRWYVSL